MRQAQRSIKWQVVVATARPRQRPRQPRAARWAAGRQNVTQWTAWFHSVHERTLTRPRPNLIIT